MHTTLSFVLLSAGLLAQGSYVFPSTHATIPNGSSYISNVPFSAGISRIQIVYEGWDMTLPVNTPITRIGFRQDSTQTSVSRILQLEVRMGQTSATATSLSTTFDNNYLGAPAIVYAQGLFTLPALSAATPNSIVWVNLTTPYVYTGGNLLVEFRVLGNNNANAGFYYPLDLATYVSTVTPGVQGCLNSGGQRAVLTSNPTAIGSNWYLSLSSAPANGPIAIFVAANQQLSAPYSLSIIGLDPSCQGQLPVGNLASFSGTTNSSGGTSWSVPVPYNLALNNAYMSSQVVALDFFVPGSLVVSNADQIQFGVNPAESFLVSQGSATSMTGSIYANYGIVTLFN
ncbi:MAG: hypothetical protein ABIP94_04945 [Planctomycetota bacterium]